MLNQLYVGQRIDVDGDRGTIVHIKECDFYTASSPAVHTQEKVIVVHFDDLSICEFRERDFNEYDMNETI